MYIYMYIHIMSACICNTVNTPSPNQLHHPQSFRGGDGDKSKAKNPNKTDGATRGPGTTSALDDDDEVRNILGWKWLKGSEM